MKYTCFQFLKWLLRYGNHDGDGIQQEPRSKKKKKKQRKTELGTLSINGWDKDQVKPMRKLESHLQVITENNYKKTTYIYIYIYIFF